MSTELASLTGERSIRDYLAGSPADDAPALLQAIGDIGAARATLLLDAPITLLTSVTVPSNVTLRVTPPGIVTLGSGVTLTVNGPFVAPPAWIVDTSRGGTLSLGPGACDRIYAEWWGARAAPSGYDDAALTAAIACAAAITGTIQLLPATYHLLNTSLTPTNVRLVGANENSGDSNVGTVITMASTTTPVFSSPSNCWIEHLQTLGGSDSLLLENGAAEIYLTDVTFGAPVGSGIHISTGGAERIIARKLTITNSGSHGIYADNTTGAYMDKSLFEKLLITQAGGDGVHVECVGHGDTFLNPNLVQTYHHAWYLTNALVDWFILNPNHESTGFSPNKLWLYTTTSATTSSNSNQIVLNSVANLSVGDTLTVIGSEDIGNGAGANPFLQFTVSAIDSSTLTVTLSANVGYNLEAGAYVTNALYDEFYFPGITNSVNSITIINPDYAYIDSGAWANGVRCALYGMGVYSGLLINGYQDSGSLPPVYDPYGKWQLIGTQPIMASRRFHVTFPSLVGPANDHVWISTPAGADIHFREQAGGTQASPTFTDWIWDVLPPSSIDQTTTTTKARLKGEDGTLLTTRTVPLNGVYMIPSGTTTPDVSISDVLITNNSAATTITGFTATQNGTTIYPGQRITIVFGDANTTIQNGTNIFLKSGANFTGALHTGIVLVYTGSVWVEPGGSA